MRIDDFIVLGRTVPEESAKYGRRVCMAGYSATLGGLSRIYPLTVDNPLRSRHQAALKVMANPRDSRHESYKLQDAVDSIYAVSDAPAWSTAAVCDLAATTYASSIDALNQAKRSLGFIAIQGVPKLVWKERTLIYKPEQLLLFDELANDLRTAGFLAGQDYPRIPYIEFKDGHKWRCLQLREWGCFEYLRKHDFDGGGIEKALGLHQHGDQFYALVGNMAHRRNVWLIIQLFHAPQPSLFSNLAEVRS